MAKMFEDANAYEAAMGRWSTSLAPQFVNFANVRGGRVLDVGCGTGSLINAVAASARQCGIVGGVVGEIVGIDPSLSSVQYARSRFTDPRITIDHGNALELPYAAGAFDHTLALLVLMFIPQAEQAASEMCRVTRPEGTVAACNWVRGGLEISSLFWEVAVKLDPETAARAERPVRLDQSGELAALWQRTGLRQVEESILEMRMDFTSFDDYWQPLLQGSGPSGMYVASLPADHRDTLRQALQTRLYGDQPAGGFSRRARALAVRGVMP